MRRHRHAKIVATVGPASSSPDRLHALFLAGVDTFRLNFSHGTHDDHARVHAAIRALEREVGRPIGILQDLQGPTEAGAALVRLGRQTRLLDDEARAALEEHVGRVEVTVAVNADSLATWFLPALAALWLADLHGGGVTIALLTVGVVAYALLALLHPERQYWHDVACGTRLITWRPARPQSRAEATRQNPAP